MGDLTGARTLLTGATGFIGANLARALVRGGAEVHAVVRLRSNFWRIADLIPPLVVHRADLNDFEVLKDVIAQVSPEIIFHLAAPGGHPGDPAQRIEMLRTVVLGTHNLLEAASPIAYQRLVHICSSTVYGHSPQPLQETHRLEPVSFRGVAKAAAAILCRQHARSSGRPVIVLRPFSVYGYWESGARLIPTAILAALRDREMRLTVPGFRRDLIFVPDMVEACLLALQADVQAGEAINIGSGVQWSNEGIVQQVQAISGSQFKVQAGVYPAQAPDTSHWIADIQKAKDLLDWEPGHNLQSGLEKTIAWFRRHLDAYP